MQPKPYNKRLLIEPIVKKQDKENTFEVPRQFKLKDEKHLEQKYINAKVIDQSDDIYQMITKDVIFNLVGYNVTVETFAMETVTIDGKEFVFIPLQGVICVWKDE